MIFSRPSYQDGVADVVGVQRGVPDIAMSAACSGLVNTYQSFPGQPAGWYVACGTSEATPMFAGIVALADQVAHHPVGPHQPGAVRPFGRQHAPGIVDITQGNNTVSFTQNGTNYTRSRDSTPVPVTTWHRASVPSMPPTSFPSWPAAGGGGGYPAVPDRGRPAVTGSRFR